MKKRIEKYFPAALAVVGEVLMNDKTKLIDREYQAYIAAFGSSVLQMGLLPTLAVYADQESGSLKDRPDILLILARTLMADNGKFLSDDAKKVLAGKEHKLFSVAVNNPGIQKELTERILDAAVAVKLCLRTFKITKP